MGRKALIITTSVLGRCGAAGGIAVGTFFLVRHLRNRKSSRNAGKSVEESFRELTSALKTTNLLLGHMVHARVQSYVATSATETNNSQQESFRKGVTTYYGYQDEKTKPQLCMLTDCAHDWHDIVAGHIVPRCRAKDAWLDLGKIDINAPRNGIFWSRAVEGAYSAGLFCFSSPGPCIYRFRLLNQEYASNRVQDWPTNPPLKTSSKKALGDLTWGELHEEGVLHLPLSGNQPYKRCLCFMSRMLLLNAKLRGWDRPEDVNSSSDEFEYMSEDSKLESTTAWVNAGKVALTS